MHQNTIAQSSVLDAAMADRTAAYAQIAAVHEQLARATAERAMLQADVTRFAAAVSSAQEDMATLKAQKNDSDAAALVQSVVQHAILGAVLARLTEFCDTETARADASAVL